MKYILLFSLFSIAFYSCQENTLDGHWHLKSSLHTKGQYELLDMVQDTGHFAGHEFLAHREKSLDRLHVYAIECYYVQYDIEWINADSIVLRGLTEKDIYADIDDSDEVEIDTSIGVQPKASIIIDTKTIIGNIAYTGHRCNKKDCIKEQDAFSDRILNIQLPINSDHTLFETDYVLNPSIYYIGRPKNTTDTVYKIKHSYRVPYLDLLEQVRDNIGLIIDKETPMYIVMSFVEQLKNTEKVQQIYLLNQIKTEPHQPYCIGYIPLKEAIPISHNLKYAEWLSKYHLALKKDTTRRINSDVNNSISDLKNGRRTYMSKIQFHQKDLY